MAFLHANALSGPIPAELGNLAKAGFSGFDRTIPFGPDSFRVGEPCKPEMAESGRQWPLWNYTEWIWQSYKLDGAVLREQCPYGPIPSELGNLENLEWLRLRDNALTGPIPVDFGNLTKLQGLQLGRNSLTGPIPPALGNLSDLFSTKLYDNALTAPVPSPWETFQV